MILVAKAKQLALIAAAVIVQLVGLWWAPVRVWLITTWTLTAFAAFMALFVLARPAGAQSSASTGQGMQFTTELVIFIIVAIGAVAGAWWRVATRHFIWGRLLEPAAGFLAVGVCVIDDNSTGAVSSPNAARAGRTS